MARIAVVAFSSPLLADGLAHALAGVADWQAHVQPHAGAADVVLTGAHTPDSVPGLTAEVPVVVLVDDTQSALAWSARAGSRAPPSAQARPLALLPRQATPAQLRAAVTAVLLGLSVHEAGAPWSAQAWTLAGTASPGYDLEPLTPRELQVFELLGKGLSNRDIGGVLEISAHTAKYHVGQILAKVGAATRAEAVSTGLRMGLIGL